MNYLSMAALIHIYRDGPQVPDAWLRATLDRHWAGFTGDDPAARTRAWAVGGVLGTESLVQMRPVVRDPQHPFTDDFLRAPCQCTIAGFAASSGPARPPRFGITRFQRWIALVGNPGLNPALDADTALHGALREALRSSLSPVFRRSLRDGTDRELIGMTLIANLHAATSASKTYASGALLREALRSLDQRLEVPATIHVMISDGRSVGILHRGGQARLVTPPPADRRRPLIHPSSPSSASSPRFSGGPDSAEDAAHAALLLLSPPGAPPPAGADSETTAIADEVFSVQALHPVRIDRD